MNNPYEVNETQNEAASQKFYWASGPNVSGKTRTYRADAQWDVDCLNAAYHVGREAACKAITNHLMNLSSSNKNPARPQ